MELEILQIQARMETKTGAEKVQLETKLEAAREKLQLLKRIKELENPAAVGSDSSGETPLSQKKERKLGTPLFYEKKAKTIENALVVFNVQLKQVEDDKTLTPAAYTKKIDGIKAKIATKQADLNTAKADLEDAKKLKDAVAAERKRVQEKAAAKKAEQKRVREEAAADDLGSPSEEDSGDDSGDNSEDRKRGTKRTLDEREEASDNEDVDMSGDSVQNLIGNMGAIIMGLEAGWKKASLIEHGFLRQLPNDKKRWSEAEQLDAEKMREEVQEIMSEYVDTKEARDSFIAAPWTFLAGPPAKAAKLCYEIVQRKAEYEEQGDVDAEVAGHAEELAALNDLDKEKLGAHVVGKMKSGNKQGSSRKHKHEKEVAGPSTQPTLVD